MMEDWQDKYDSNVQMDELNNNQIEEISIDGSESVTSSVLEQKMNEKLHKMKDPSYHSFKFKKFRDPSKNDDGKKKDSFFKLEVYDSGHKQKSYVRNAVTGILYKNVLIGTKQERCLFKVTYAGDKLGNRQKVTGTNTNSDGPLALYYDSYDQWERHFKDVLYPNSWNTNTREKTSKRWAEKMMKSKIHIEPYLKPSTVVIH